MKEMQMNLPELMLPYPTRPGRNSDPVINLAVEKMLPKILHWMGDRSYTDDEVVNIRKELRDAIDYTHDGYEAGKYLDSNCYWNSDSELVDLLDDADFYKIDAYDTILEKWVLQNGVEPKHAVGDTVEFMSQKTKVCGVIKNVDTKRGMYSIYCESLGHILPGSGKSGTTGLYVNYEDVLNKP